MKVSGFGWDTSLQRFKATDTVWDDYVKVCPALFAAQFHLTQVYQAHPKAAWFRTHSFPFYDDLHYLSEDNIATGEHALAIGGPVHNQALQVTVEPDGDNPSSDEDSEDPQIPSQVCYSLVYWFGPCL